ncbi:MAG: YcfL family protein [Fusobacteria bacterium]|nr:YcfL family protein [Fusobacteriota bacterium]
MKLKKIIIAVTLTAGLVLAFAGCATSPTIQAGPNQVPNQVLTNGIKVTSTNMTRIGSILNGIATVTNLSSATQTVYYKFVWYDANGTAYNDQNPWTPLQIQAGFSQTVSQAATTPNAISFNVMLSAKAN